MSNEEAWPTWTPKEGILIEGLDDWTDVSWATNYVRTPVPQSFWRPATIGLIAEMLVEGLIIPGDLRGGEHCPWGCSTGDAIARITSEWINTQWPHEVPYPGAIVWFANTEAGNEIARAALAREGISE
ncbi:hypothetical protein QBL02_13755 [Leucobacter sp. UT-8R-CII-1-4]|uniref:hypothetical protein n=1 Tax=Leucobacter sp. UT-8R-CII-1-4 TaxID=3040075 RepID=UPI0024A89FC6|nr:hypothetical protein [Leucobacter sp. UT-8R-CII-1-4]MDI6024602.1 hypothetical protein [Leucobacter sp. UT-8R-CII-1-4]